MPRVWFTADTHFGHANVIRYCQRPFGSVEEMDAELVARWNAVVRPDDDVWHLGDFCLGRRGVASSYLERLAGRKHLIWGNHDSPTTRADLGWASSQGMAEIGVNGRRVILLHYAMRVWPKAHHGSLHLYGHSHGCLPGDGQSCDVGVDVPAWKFRPVSLTEIEAHLRTLPERPKFGSASLSIT